MWLFSAYPAGKGWLNQNGPAIICSHAKKHVSNVTAWLLKSATGLPWIAHFSDPWQGDNLNLAQAWVAPWLERRIFRDADAIMTVNERLRGVIVASVHITGNTVVDALGWMRARLPQDATAELPRHVAQAIRGHRMLLVTGHRRESFGDGIASICEHPFDGRNSLPRDDRQAQSLW